jgi:hypothetical protein
MFEKQIIEKNKKQNLIVAEVNLRMVNFFKCSNWVYKHGNILPEQA